MKNFLQVLLVGTILVSAGDGYSQILTGGWMNTSSASSAAASAAASAASPGGGILGTALLAGYSDEMTDEAKNILSTNPLSFSAADIKYNNNLVAYWKDGKWYTTQNAAGTGFKITGGKLDFSAPENLTITGTANGKFNFGSSSGLDIRNAGLLDGRYTIENVETPSGIILNGEYNVENLGNRQLQFTSADGQTVFIRDLQKDGWTIKDGAITINDYNGGDLEIKFGDERIYYADNVTGGTNGASASVAVGGRTYQTDGTKLKADSVSPGSSSSSDASSTNASGSTEEPVERNATGGGSGALADDLPEDTYAHRPGDEVYELSQETGCSQTEVREMLEEKGMTPEEIRSRYKDPSGANMNATGPAFEGKAPTNGFEGEVIYVGEESLVYDPYTGTYVGSDGMRYRLDDNGRLTTTSRGGYDMNSKTWDPDADFDFKSVYGATPSQIAATVPATSLPTTIDGTFVSYNANHGTAIINHNGVNVEVSGNWAKALANAKAGDAVSLAPQALSSISVPFGSYASGFFGGFGANFGNFFQSAIDTVMMPVNLVKGAFNLLTGKSTLDIGAKLTEMGANFGQNITAGFKSFGAGLGLNGSIYSSTSQVDPFGNTTESIEEFFDKQVEAANKTAEGQKITVKEVMASIPAAVSNVSQYPIMLLQTDESGKQNEATKRVKVKAENALLDSQGAPTDSTVGGVSLEGTNLASAASQMVVLLEYNPVDLNLLKMDDLDLSKDKDQKTLRQRRDLLLQMYATSAQIIAEGSNDISEKFYERITSLSESLPQTTGSLGSASVLNDSERYPYFEMVRQTALSATQLGLKGADILPNLRTAAPESQEQ